MTWLAWRQFRVQALAGAIGLALLGAVLIATGPGLADDYADGLALCGSDCREFNDLFTDQHQAALLATTAIVLLLPALLGLFWGAPLVARELEAGTHRLVWNQSVTRTRWLGVKLALVGLAVATAAGLVTWTIDRWSAPIAAASLREPRFPFSITFSSSGVVPVAYALFAFVLGVAVGMLVRRPLPAMAITLAAFAVLQFVVPIFVRPHLAPLVTETVVISPTNLDGLSQAPGGMRVMATSPEPGGWLLSSYTVDAAGRKVDAIAVSPDDPACAAGQGIDPCMAEIERLGYRQVSSHHPPSQFWRLQWTEAAGYVGLSAGLVGFCFWWVRRRVT